MLIISCKFKSHVFAPMNSVEAASAAFSFKSAMINVVLI